MRTFDPRALHWRKEASKILRRMPRRYRRAYWIAKRDSLNLDEALTYAMYKWIRERGHVDGA